MIIDTLAAGDLIQLNDPKFSLFNAHLMKCDVFWLLIQLLTGNSGVHWVC